MSNVIAHIIHKFKHQLYKSKSLKHLDIKYKIRPQNNSISCIEPGLAILDAWGWCTGTTQKDGMGREEGSGWGTRVYLWWIHIDILQNQYNIIKLKNKNKMRNEKSKKKNSIKSQI